jgi:hypothetical protein
MEPLNIQMNVSEKGKQNSGEKNEELIKKETIKNTPFEIVTINEKCFIGLGNYKLSEEVIEEEKDILKKRIEDKDWLLTTYLINALTDAKEKLNNLNK